MLIDIRVGDHSLSYYKHHKAIEDCLYDPFQLLNEELYDQLKELVVSMAGKRLRYVDLITDNGLSLLARPLA